MATAKWFYQLNAESTVASAASGVLRARLEAVRRYLGKLADRSRRDPEDIHQLRVSTRRLSAALAIFKPVLDKRLHGAVRRAGKRLRRAAGATRDLDVMRARLDGARTARDAAARELSRPLRSMWRGEQQQAQRGLRQVLRKWGTRYCQSAAGLLEALRSLDSRAGQAPLRKLARARLGEYLTDLRVAADRDLDDLDHLHQLRIKAKRVRYALEVFVGCFRRREIMPIYRVLVDLQDELGRINDLRNLKERLREWSDRLDSRPVAGAEGGAASLGRIIAEVDAEMGELRGRALRRWSGRRVAAFCGRVKKKLRRLDRTAPARPRKV